MIIDILTNLSTLVEIIAVTNKFSDENRKINLMQLGVIMQQIGNAIKNNDPTRLEELKIELDDHAQYT